MTVSKLSALYKDIFSTPLPELKYTNLRNALAHDIENVQINDGTISFNALKKHRLTQQEAKLDDVFKHLLNYARELQKS